MRRTVLARLSVLLLATSAQGTDFATEMMEATFKLYHQKSTATCVLVRREAPGAGLYLVTAAHVLEKTTGETAIVVLREPQEDGSYKRCDHTIQIRVGENPLWTRDKEQDVAVLPLSEPLPIPVAGLPMARIADQARLKEAGVHICTPLFVLTFPERTEANPAGFPVARQGIFAGPPLLPVETYPRLLVDITTFSGDSGGPVFLPGVDGHPLLAGIVLSRFRHDERVETEYAESVVHHPLGLAGVLHGHFVLQTLEAAAKPPPPEAEKQEAPKAEEQKQP